MGKVIKMIDLLNMIERKEVRDGQKFRVTLGSNMTRNIYYVESEGCNILCFKHCSDDFWWSDEYNLNDKVEILDEEDEIDIQSIEELPDYNFCVEGNKNKINEIIKVIKQLDNKINKLESNT